MQQVCRRHFRPPRSLTRKSGYDTTWQLPFKIIGRNGVDLNEKWERYPTSYLSMCVDEFPNMFMALGPNSIIGAGLLMPILEFSVGYAVQAAAKMQRERLKSMEVKADAVRDFDQYIEVRLRHLSYFAIKTEALALRYRVISPK